MRLLKYYILFLFILIWISPVSFPSYTVIISILIFVILDTYKRFYSFKINKQNDLLELKIYTYKNIFITFSLGLLISNQLSIFYTGKGLGQTMINLFSGASNYLFYQEFFKDNFKSISVLNRVPAVIGIIFLKVSSLVGVAQAIFKRSFIGLILIIPYLLFNIARGTSIEIFEIVVSFIFFKSIQNYNLKIFGKRTILILIFGSLIFGYNVLIRTPDVIKDFSIMCYTDELCFESNRLSKLFPLIGLILFFLSGYFSFGPYYLSVFMTKQFLENPIKLLIGNWKFNSSSEFVCNYIDCGVNWEPDLAYTIYNFGIIGTLMIGMLIFKFYSKLFRDLFNKKNFSSGKMLLLISCYFIFLQILSFPVGNFITSSTPNIILFTFLLSYQFLKTIYVKRS